MKLESAPETARTKSAPRFPAFLPGYLFPDTVSVGSEARAVEGCYTLARLAALLVLLAGLAVLATAGWAALFPNRRIWWEAWIAGRPLAGLGVLLLAAVIRGVVRVDRHQAGSAERALLYGAAGLLVLLGALTWVEYATGGGLWPRWLVRPAAPGSQWGSRLSLGAGLCFVFWGAGAGCLLRGGHPWVSLGQMLAHAAGFTALIGTVGFLYGRREALAQTLPWAEMTPLAAVVWLVAALGLVCARPRAGMMALFTADSAGGLLLRRVLLPSALVPVGVGAAVLLAERHRWLPAQFGEVLLVVTLVLVAGVHLWQIAGTLHRRDAERLTAVNQVRLQAAALNHAGECIFITDRRGVILWVNEALLRCSGYRREDLVGRTPRVFKSGRHDAAFYAHLWQTILSGRVWRGEVVNRARDGSLFTLEEVIAPFALEGEGVTHFISVLSDITDKKRQEAELARRLHILESSLNEIYVFDAATLRFEYVNAAARRNLGYPAERFRELTPVDLKPDFTPESFAALLEPLRSGVRDRQVFETRHRRADGSCYPVEVHLELVRDPERPVFLAVIRDISEQRAALARLRESEAELGRAQAVAHIGSWSLDLTTNRLHWSEETYRMFGVPPGQPVTENTFYAKVHPEDVGAVKAAWQAALAGRPYRVEHRIVVDGRVRWVEERAELEFDPTGRPLRGVGTVQDITERRELEEQLRQAQKLEAIGQLAGGVAHDFNNLLTVILLNSNRTATAPDLPAAVRRANQEIAAAAERAAALTRQLLLFSRRQPLQPRVLDLNQVIRDLTKMLRRLLPANVAVDLRLVERPLRVHADPIMLEQVLMNLAINAGDAMPRGGRLTIQTGERTFLPVVAPAGGAVAAEHTTPGSWVWWQVRDTGTGIAPDILPRIFEPFFTTKGPGKGTGLGLATVQSIVRQLGGEITVTSRVGEGTCFDLFLPAPADAPNSPAGSSTAARPAGRGETILLVEDEVAVRNLTVQVLREAGYRVLSAASAEEALGLWQAERTAIDLLASDLIMPGRYKGNELAELCQREKPGLPVLLLSGYNPESVGAVGESRSGVSFLQKPFSPDQLLRAVREALDRPAGRG
jgi:PAS domain S-box-containing protein